jgi:hypothetical protein
MGTGSVLASGSITSTTLTITQDSTITWDWAVQPPSSISKTTGVLHVLKYYVTPITSEPFYIENTNPSPDSTLPGSTSLPPPSINLGSSSYTTRSGSNAQLLFTLQGEPIDVDFNIVVTVLYSGPSGTSIPAPISLVALSSSPTVDADNEPLIGGPYQVPVAPNSPYSATVITQYTTDYSDNGISASLSQPQNLQSGVSTVLTYNCHVTKWAVTQSFDIWKTVLQAAVTNGEEFTKLPFSDAVYSALYYLQNNKDISAFIFQVNYSLKLGSLDMFHNFVPPANVQTDYSMLQTRSSQGSWVPANSITINAIVTPAKVLAAIQYLQAHQNLFKAGEITSLVSGAADLMEMTGSEIAIDGMNMVPVVGGITDAAGVVLTLYSAYQDYSLTNSMNDPSPDYTQYVPPIANPTFIDSLQNCSSKTLLYAEYMFYSNLNASVESNAKSNGALIQNATAYAISQEEMALQYANNASVYYQQLIPAVNELINELNSSGYLTQSSFETGRLQIINNGIPQEATNIIQEMGLSPYVNISEIETASYVPLNFSASSLTNTAEFLSEEENASLTFISNSFPNTVAVNYSYLILEISITSLIVIAVTVVALMLLKRRQKADLLR